MEVKQSSALFLTCQDLLRTHVLPSVLLLAAIGMVMYWTFWKNMADPNDYQNRNFLGFTALQMAIILALKAKIMRCADCVAVLSRTAIKVLLVHACFLFLRLFTIYFIDDLTGFWEYDSSIDTGVNFVALISSLIILNVVFEVQLCSLASFWDHLDVLALLVFAFSCTGYNMYTAPHRLNKLDIITFLCNSVECLTYMPAARLITMDIKAETFVPISRHTGQSRAMNYLFWMLCFYTYEDVINPMLTLMSESAPGILMAAHFVHFGMLMDFAGLFLVAACSPKGDPSVDMSNVT